MTSSGEGEKQIIGYKWIFGSEAIELKPVEATALLRSIQHEEDKTFRLELFGPWRCQEGGFALLTQRPRVRVPFLLEPI